MNYIKETETILWYYRDLYHSIEEMSKRVGRLVAKAGPSNLTAMVLDDTGIRSGKVDEAVNMFFEIQKLMELKQKTKRELDEIENILSEFDKEKGCELYGTVLRKWYIERIPKEDIAREIGYNSKQSVYDIKNKAIRKLAVRYFGIDALKAI